MYQNILINKQCVTMKRREPGKGLSPNSTSNVKINKGLFLLRGDTHVTSTLRGVGGRQKSDVIGHRVGGLASVLDVQCFFIIIIIIIIISKEN